MITIATQADSRSSSTRLIRAADISSLSASGSSSLPTVDSEQRHHEHRDQQDPAK
jgi:hypothetical protein